MTVKVCDLEGLLFVPLLIDSIGDTCTDTGRLNQLSKCWSR